MHFVLFVNPNHCIVETGLKFKLTLAAYAPTAQIRVPQEIGVSLTTGMLHVRIGQSGFLS
jgi:hypothetical protein